MNPYYPKVSWCLAVMETQINQNVSILGSRCRHYPLIWFAHFGVVILFVFKGAEDKSLYNRQILCRHRIFSLISVVSKRDIQAPKHTLYTPMVPGGGSKMVWPMTKPCELHKALTTCRALWCSLLSFDPLDVFPSTATTAFSGKLSAALIQLIKQRENSLGSISVNTLFIVD